MMKQLDPRRLRRWTWPILARWLLLTVVLVMIGMFFPGQAGDGIYDWLATHEAIDGNPHRPINDIAPEYGLSPIGQGPHPRLPGAFILQLPLLLVPLSWAPFVMRVLSAAALIAVSRFIRPTWLWALIAVPAFHALWYGQGSSIVTLALAIAVGRNVGWPIGVATVLRAWPWTVALAFLVVGKWRQAASATFVFFGLNGLGLLFPGVTVQGTIEAFTAAANYDSTLALPLGWGAAIAVGILTYIRARPEALSLSVVASLAASPVIWMNYLTALMVPLGHIAAQARQKLMPTQSETAE